MYQLLNDLITIFLVFGGFFLIYFVGWFLMGLAYAFGWYKPGEK